jgi:hypothetical protein
LEVDLDFGIDVEKHLKAFKAPKGKLFRYLYYSLYATYLKSWHVRNFFRRTLPSRLKDALTMTLFDSTKPPINEATAIYLRDLYQEDILRLQELIGDNLQMWLERK